MTVWHIIAVLTPALGALAVVYGLRFFPLSKPGADQYEMDLDIPADYRPRRSAMAQSVDNAADMVREEVKRIKKLPPLR